ncbi:MAG: 4Fe-4S dicluster domain-containing protein [Candidatus Omnitrophota bacterium]
MAKIKIEKDRCKGCFLCIESCPQKLIEISPIFNKLGIRPAAPKKGPGKLCTGCCFCAIICPDGCIEVFK